MSSTANILTFGLVPAKMMPKAKTPPPVAPMPDQPLIDQAARKSAAMQLSRTGRASTVLSAGTDTGDRLGP